MTDRNDKNNIAKQKFILVGEDDIDDQEILQEIFETVDPTFRLHFVGSGKRLITHIDTLEDGHLPCLIILDYNMPELNGAEILIKLKNNERIAKVPKIIWSTSNAPAFRSKCLELGASDYLVKPSKISLIEDMVKHMLSFCN